ncbi:TIGR01777 family oxidoreductase [Blastopirellula sp. JC732]|uniref:TIGR01777 family oxidoreductase n=1 Tax=Blastopirellula sediminis TaxID=2894196 RepID=A0A9X1SE57_9BACT|nr:TIGR01777 family oxidoreductase [Blastopirellula sediminis]MCC9607792.1 TIGR01777 family oxidoreductase [Blastopirellula sediminis]MCC9627415.1 TIGR01777 family oxidoreductase [Blastopirellula sediminis]
MTHQVFQRRSEIPVPVEVAFAWHLREGALARLTPPWESVTVEKYEAGLAPGSQAVLKTNIGPVPVRWLAEHRTFIENELFSDVQLSGPFAHWEHEHRFGSIDKRHCYLEDHVEYSVPGGELGKMLGGAYVADKLERMFRYRHATLLADLAAHQPYLEREAMKIAISGASGLVGKSLTAFLTTGGHEVVPLTRSKSKSGVYWNYEQGEIDAASLAGIDAVVHLAGEGIAEARWTDKQKAKIRNSRVDGTTFLATQLAALPQPPKTLVCASAIGYYGDSGDQIVDEKSIAGEGFLPDVCRAWELSCEPAAMAGIRVANVRLGIVLSPQGGALAKMLTPFKLGVGGVIGSGKQYWSWITLDDVIGGIHHCLMNDELIGPVNLTAPNPATNREFTKTLGHVLHRPTILPVPSFAAKLAMGEMANDLLLASSRVMPTRLLETNYTFRDPELEPALRRILGL